MEGPTKNTRIIINWIKILMIGMNSLLKIIKILYNKISIKLNSKPYLRSSIYCLYDEIRLIEYRIKSFIFEEIPNKVNIIYINPENIIYEKDLIQNNWRLFLKFIKPLFNLRLNDRVNLINGDWDLKENLNLFEKDIKHISYHLHFIKGIKWNNTPYYKREAERYLIGKVRKEYKSAQELNLKFKYHDNLFEKIKQEGFKTQREIIESKGTVINYGRGKIIRKSDDDITVGIGRDGDIIFFDGRHRLNIAKILKLKRIPVRVLVIHPKFILKLKK